MGEPDFATKAHGWWAGIEEVDKIDELLAALDPKASALAAENARLRKFLTDEREQHMISIRGATHWDGCHKVHRNCARVREIDAALQEKKS